ncbi:MAG: hypothetical protein DBX59_09120 [Bacillota bacterium]|nr:MAG: hypothetical protein DBX59_09120 [Bacillota bacterium]
MAVPPAPVAICLKRLEWFYPFRGCSALFSRILRFVLLKSGGSGTSGAKRKRQKAAFKEILQKGKIISATNAPVAGIDFCKSVPELNHNSATLMEESKGFLFTNISFEISIAEFICFVNLLGKAGACVCSPLSPIMWESG